MSSIETAEVRSQFEFSPVITILRTCGKSALSGSMVDTTSTTKHSSPGIVVVVVGIVVVGVVVVVVGDENMVNEATQFSGGLATLSGSDTLMETDWPAHRPVLLC